MVKAVQDTIDDSVRNVDITDFLGGLNSEKDQTDMNLNESPFCQNVFARPGKLIGRNGSVPLVSGLPAGSDGTLFFFDKGGNRRQIVWSAGNLYQVTFGISTLIATAVYNAGQRIASTTLYGTVYYSDGIVPMRQWEPLSNIEKQTPSSGAPLSLPPPAFNVVVTYEGSIVAGCVTVPGFAQEPDTFRWCDVNDPTTWNGTSAQAVGEGFGGKINAMNIMGVSAQGVSPFRALWVGKDENGIFGYQGALGSQTEFLIPASCGCLDGNSVQFIPGPSGQAYVCWLGTDRKVWFTNGISADELSGNIRTELSNYILAQIQANPNQLFSSVRNDANYQYVLDCGGNRQYVYDFQNQYWTKYQGWPSGFWTAGTDSTGFPAIFCAPDVAGANAGTFWQANTGLTDDGAIIPYIWKTGLLNAGNMYQYKEWIWAYVTFATNGGQVEVTVTEGPNTTGSTLVSDFTIQAPLTAAGQPFILDQSLLDGPDLLTPNPETATYTTYRFKNAIACPVDPSNYSEFFSSTGPLFESLRAADVQLELSQTNIAAHFEIWGARLQYIPFGYAEVGQTL